MTDAENGDQTPTRVRTGWTAVWLGAALVLMAINLRVAVTSVGPVLRQLMHVTGLSETGASVLTMLPSLCFGLFGPLGPALARRMGTERALLIVAVLLAVGTAIRGLATVPALFAGQILACFSIGIVNVLLPGLVKRDFPKRAALMTGLYTMSLSFGGAVAAAATVPLADVLGGSWAGALAFWAIPAAVAAAIWAPQVPRGKWGGGQASFKISGVWTDALAWQVTLFMGLQSAIAYTMFGWLAHMLQDRGLSAVDAGYVLSVSVVGQSAGALFAPTLATCWRDQRVIDAIGAAICVAGILGCFYAPLWSIWVWASVLGLAQGAVFAIAVMLIVLRAADSHVAAHLSGMAQGVGYLIASLGPLIAGELRGWTGNWNGVALFCVALGVASAIFGIGAGRDRHVRAVLVRR
ncbi:MAG TPA: MFS transporter [Pirellulales bacterium]|jgi:CP family cyanate transporter-like MFS transporter|nr:MFS transporter [Pirellulales bacterium]